MDSHNLGVFHWNKYLLCNHCKEIVKAKFCKCHDITGIATCAKLCCDHTQARILRSRATSFLSFNLGHHNFVSETLTEMLTVTSLSWGTHYSTNFVNFTVTLVSDMEIVFGALVSLKSTIRWFWLKDNLRPCMPALRMSVYVWCCLFVGWLVIEVEQLFTVLEQWRTAVPKIKWTLFIWVMLWPPYWKTHSPIGANLQSDSIKLHGLIRESQ